MLVLVRTVSALALAAAVAWGSGCEASLPVPSPSPGPQSSTSVPHAAADDSPGTQLGSPLSRVDPALLTGNFAVCGDCHSLLDRSAGENSALVDEFSHRAHLEKEAACGDCHPIPTHMEDGIRKPTMDLCYGCHSGTDSSRPPGECDLCHPPDFDLKPESHARVDWLPDRPRLDAVEAEHAAAGRGSCALCHSDSFCSDCHGLAMPHPDRWEYEHPEVAGQVGGSTCNKCHPDRESCKVCHHPGYTAGGPPWWQIHPRAAAQVGVEVCISCHSTKTCAHCHISGEYREFD